MRYLETSNNRLNKDWSIKFQRNYQDEVGAMKNIIKRIIAPLSVTLSYFTFYKKQWKNIVSVIK